MEGDRWIEMAKTIFTIVHGKLYSGIKYIHVVVVASRPSTGLFTCKLSLCL